MSLYELKFYNIIKKRNFKILKKLKIERKNYQFFLLIKIQFKKLYLLSF